MNKNDNLKDYLYASIFAALICILAFLSIPVPLGPPITGQTLGVMLAGSILKPKQAALSMTTYLILGSVGLPVFSGGSGGFGVITGPYGGYLIGFLVGAVIISLIKGKKNSILLIGTANLAGGIVVINLIGFLWLSHITGLSYYKTLFVILPYLPGDIIKLCCATLIAHSVNIQLGDSYKKNLQ